MPLRCGYPPPGCMTPLDCGSHRYHSSTSSSKPEHCLGAISARLARSDGREAKRRQLKHINVVILIGEIANIGTHFQAGHRSKPQDRKNGGSGKGVSGRGELGWSRINTKKKEA